MSSQRQVLLQSIATIVADYRQGEIPTIDSNHVDRWVSQFDKFGFNGNAQIVILEGMKHILDKYYISRVKTWNSIDKLLTKELFENNSAEIMQDVKFLQIQKKGNSQKDLLSISEQILKNRYNISFKDCSSQSPAAYIYLDDCLYSGNTVRRDIEFWLPNAFKGSTLYLIFFAVHTYGYKYVKDLIEKKAQSQGISVKILKAYEFHNSRWKSSNFDCFWPRNNPGDVSVDAYVQKVDELRQNSGKSLPPLFRPNNMPTQDNIFSSSANREIIESAFLKAGVYIASLPNDPKKNIRPLGYDYLETLGFGSLFVTYRNIANNCPLALWWGDINQGYPLNGWYPLFPRIVNSASNLEQYNF